MRYPAVRLVALLSSLSTTSLNNCSTIVLVDVCNISNISLFNPSLFVSPSLPRVYDIMYIYVYYDYIILLYINKVYVVTCIVLLYFIVTNYDDDVDE